MNANSVPLSPISFLQRSGEVFAAEPAIVDQSGRGLSYGEMLSRAGRMAQALRDAGVAAGDRVAVLSPNSASLLLSHFGVPGARAVLVALNTRLAPPEFAYILNHCGARVLLIDSGLTKSIRPIRNQVSGLELIIDIPSGEGEPLGDATLDEWIGQASAGELVPPTDETHPISINYTSGTTGEPKGVVYSHRGAYLNALGVAQTFGLTAESVYLWTLPMFHCNGWCFTWGVTAAGGRHVTLTKPDAGEVIRLIKAERVTHLCGAPVVFNHLSNDPALSKAQFDVPIRAALGGAPPSPSLIRRMETAGIEVVHLYGLTETYGPSLVCEVQSDWPAEIADRARLMSRQGVRTVNVEGVRVVTADMQDIAADGSAIGEIVVRSNSVMLGYFKDQQGTAAALQGGWLHTGDLAVRHPDGYIEIRDRAKDMIISGGENISSIEVENVLSAHPAVLEAAVIGVPDEEWGETPIAFVALRLNSAVTEAELIEFARERIAHYKCPTRIIFQELPKTSTGKTQKHVLRAFARSATT